MTLKEFLQGCYKNPDLPIAFAVMILCTIGIFVLQNWLVIPLFIINFLAGFYLGKNL